MCRAPRIPDARTMYLLAMARAKRILDGIFPQEPITDYDALVDESKVARIEETES